MGSAPKFIFQDGCFLYRGEVNSNELHSNAAYQVAISADPNSKISVSDKNGDDFVGQIILIKSLAKHKIKCDSGITVIFLSPDSNWVLNVLKHIDHGQIATLNDDILPFKKDCELSEIGKIVREIDLSPEFKIDPRLSAAIDDLDSDLVNASILETAKRCNLSRSRLRALAREQLGVSLATLLIWRKIVTANKALSTGVSLSEAAFIGGFSDQAHFSRTMKRMFGITPTGALKVYT